MINLINGRIQDASNIFVPNGSIVLQLNVDSSVVADPGGFVCADIPVVFQFDANGDILPNAPATQAEIWSNAELAPQLSSTLLGTYYLVTLYDAKGARINKSPMWWQFPEAAGSTVDISQMKAFFTEGNLIFYPTSFTVPPPTPISLGGVFSTSLVASQWIRAINTDGTVALSQPNFTDLAGTISFAQLFAADGVTTTKFLNEAGSWVVPAAGTPAGSNTDIQFNNAGAFGGSSNFTWTNSSQTLDIIAKDATTCVTIDGSAVSTGTSRLMHFIMTGSFSNAMQLDSSGATATIALSTGLVFNLNSGVGTLFVGPTELQFLSTSGSLGFRLDNAGTGPGDFQIDGQLGQISSYGQSGSTLFPSSTAGVGAIVLRVSTDQTSPVTGNQNPTILTPRATGMYRLTVYTLVSTGVAGSTIQWNADWTDQIQAQTKAGASISGVTTGTYQVDEFVMQCQSGTAITLSSSTASSPTYVYHVRLESI